MWKTSAFDIIHLGRTPGGEQFVGFVDTIIRTHALSFSIPQKDIQTNLRTTIPDGGIDTKIDSPSTENIFGWMDTKSVWQYKATSASKMTIPKLKKEINKEYSKKCISNGYAYHLCICDSLDARKKETWEIHLTKFAKEINKNTFPVKVITSDDLSFWISFFPAVILQYFRQGASGMCLHMDVWGNNITDLTPTFIPVPDWAPILERIRDHVDLRLDPPSVVLPLQGEAGVGKTRMVFEALNKIEGIKGLVVYTEDEQYAQNLARDFANSAKRRAILIADESSVQTRIKLNGILQGHKDRIRVLTIDNVGIRPTSGDQTNWAKRIPKEIVKNILEMNFPLVSTTRCRMYSDLSGGFIRLAADMCKHDREIDTIGNLTPALGDINAYLQSRLSPRKLEVLCGIALFTKVGFKEDMGEEINLLSSLINIDKNEILNIANELHNVPGFIGKAGRYFYVTPEIIANIAFEIGWQRWVKTDSDKFLNRIPPKLVDSFLVRVSQSATEEIRELTGVFFRKKTERFETKDLISEKNVDLLVSLIDTDPNTYLSVLKNLIKQSNQKQLSALKGEGIGRWGPRRHIVWLAERLAIFPKYFYDTEFILLRLAKTENEPGIANNATAIWKQLFRIYLSGTSLTFLDRFQILERRINSKDKKTIFLSLDALKEILGMPRSRLEGPAVIFGKIPPNEWMPKTKSELYKCLSATLNLLAKLINSQKAFIRERAFIILIDNLIRLIDLGLLKDIKRIFRNKDVPQKVKIRILRELEKYLDFKHEKRDNKFEERSKYLEEVRDWMNTFIPTDIHGKILKNLGLPAWHYYSSERKKTWESEIEFIAKKLYDDNKIFKKELEWLYSDEAQSAGILGEELGKLDYNARLLGDIVDKTKKSDSSYFAKGYLIGLLNRFPDHSDNINILLDNIEPENPSLSFELSIAVGDKTNALQRALRLVDTKKINVGFLSSFISGIGSRQLNEAEFLEILKRYVFAIENGESEYNRGALLFVAHRLDEEKEIKKSPILNNDESVALFWRLIEAVGKNVDRETYWWKKVMKVLALVDSDKAAEIAASFIVGENFQLRQDATEVLVDIAKKSPEIVINRLGKIILDKKKGVYFYIEKYSNLVQSLPEELLIDWIRTNGIEAARRIARHLAPPYLTKKGEPVVPPLTEFVLRHFEDNDRVFKEFCAGVHSFEIYSGDIEAQHKKEAEIARKFLGHSLKRIREWAQNEEKSALYMARMSKQEEEEFFIKK